MPSDRDIVDQIDALVDEQLDQYDSRSGYDHNINQPVCPHCEGEFHGLPITWAMLYMRYITRSVPTAYSFANDTSPIFCVGSLTHGVAMITPAPAHLVMWNNGEPGIAREMYRRHCIDAEAAFQRRWEAERERERRLDDQTRRFAAGSGFPGDVAAALAGAARAAMEMTLRFAGVSDAAVVAGDALSRVGVLLEDLPANTQYRDPDSDHVRVVTTGHYPPTAEIEVDAGYDIGDILPAGRTIVRPDVGALFSPGGWIDIGRAAPEGIQFTPRPADAGPVQTYLAGVIQRAVVEDHRQRVAALAMALPAMVVPYRPLAVEEVARGVFQMRGSTWSGDPLPRYVAALDAAEFAYLRTALHAGVDE